MQKKNYDSKAYENTRVNAKSPGECIIPTCLLERRDVFGFCDTVDRVTEKKVDGGMHWDKGDGWQTDCRCGVATDRTDIPRLGRKRTPSLHYLDKKELPHCATRDALD